MQKRRIPFLILLTLLGIAGAGIWRSRGHNSPPIPARGGEMFQNFAPLQTPFYLQVDDRWKNETIGGSGEKLSDAGCTVCSLAMALAHFDVHLDPKELNNALKAADGYTWRGLLKWEAVSRVSNDKVTVEIVPKPSHADMDTALKNGQPILAKVLISGSTPHWVLIAGKEGDDYLIRDPLGEGNDLERLTKFDSAIFGVRIVKSGSRHL